MTDLARVTLIRELDNIYMDQSRLRRPEAPRTLGAPGRGPVPCRLLRAAYRRWARSAWGRSPSSSKSRASPLSGAVAMARLERKAGRLPQAADSLAAVRDALATPGDDSLRHWQQVNLGRFIAEGHYRLTLALVDAGRSEETRALLRAADAILGEISENIANGVHERAERTAARVREVN